MDTLSERLTAHLDQIRQQGLYKEEREILGRQGSHVDTNSGQALNFCANNYLGLAGDQRLVDAAKEALDRWGFGMSSVRFICGTQDQHSALEREIAQFLRMDDSILFSSCFDANGGIFGALLGPDDAIVSDELNHASLIDGIRLCKAARFRYRNADIEDLRRQLQAARDRKCDQILIVTDGVFSMDGSFAPLEQICDLAEEFHALVMVDDSHATGFVGEHGRGTPEYCGVEGRVDILTGTLGKALGGASGGYVAGPQAIVDTLRQQARPYLFSNTLAPVVVAGSRKALELAAQADDARAHLKEMSALFRSLMEDAGFDVLPGSHPIHAVMFRGDDGAALAVRIAARMLELGVYVTAFSFPVVPRGLARIRVQLSAAHSEDDVRACVKAFIDARESVIG
ncbi:glycine C-acetyltransferase [Pauljensenia sp. UMB10120]|uniref:glycine C-acetyltransferase n=1 Tax=Pauljensenia sp. UMB10120 TaxID=3046356 RepID=UPI00254F3513|nr:glycine C-acetyltransferase [Pauljensenia sp. UMB10120]MDK6242888.1 glycine C-acetyltransferase [Pauljensenia sp. UMB10120]